MSTILDHGSNRIVATHRISHSLKLQFSKDEYRASSVSKFMSKKLLPVAKKHLNLHGSARKCCFHLYNSITYVGIHSTARKAKTY